MPFENDTIVPIRTLNSTPNQLTIFIPYQVQNTILAQKIETHLYQIMEQAETTRQTLKIVKLKRDIEVFNLGKEYFENFNFEKNEGFYEVEYLKPFKTGSGRGKITKMDRGEAPHPSKAPTGPVVEIVAPPAPTVSEAPIQQQQQPQYIENYHPATGPPITWPTQSGPIPPICPGPPPVYDTANRCYLNPIPDPTLSGYYSHIMPNLPLYNHNAVNCQPNYNHNYQMNSIHVPEANYFGSDPTSLSYPQPIGLNFENYGVPGSSFRSQNENFESSMSTSVPAASQSKSSINLPEDKQSKPKIKSPRKNLSKSKKSKSPKKSESKDPEKPKNDTNETDKQPQTGSTPKPTFFVNPKQYNRILKRREQRKRLLDLGLIPRERKKYLHESRHRHAVMRNRSEGGRFNVGQTRIKLQALKNLEERRKEKEEKEKLNVSQSSTKPLTQKVLSNNMPVVLNF